MDGYENKKVVLAPLAGVTDAYMRLICKKMGADLTYTEMISAKGLLYRNKRTEELLFSLPEEGRLGVQLFGREPDAMAEAIKLIEEMCGERVALYDVNMGCPMPKIVNNGEGSALMNDPKTAADIIGHMKDATDKPVTAKIRSGYETKNAVEFAKVLEDAGADAITVHGRLKSDMYSGKADWNIIADVKKAVGITVYANGDVFDAEDAAAILDRTGADGVMIARGALGNPFIFREVKEYLNTGYYERPSSRERIETALRQAELTAAGKGERIGMKEMRKHGAWYIKGMKNAASARDELVRASTLEEFKRIMYSLINM